MRSFTRFDAVNNVSTVRARKSQAAYERPSQTVAAFDELENRLGRQRWLVGDRFTEPICACPDAGAVRHGLLRLFQVQQRG